MVLGIVGYVAKGIALGVVGVLFVVAAVTVLVSEVVPLLLAPLLVLLLLKTCAPTVERIRAEYTA